jgi:hypothetical protein
MYFYELQSVFSERLLNVNSHCNVVNNTFGMKMWSHDADIRQVLA